MQALAVTVRDPFHPAHSRQVSQVNLPATLNDIAPDVQTPFIVLRNGGAVLRKDWGEGIEAGDVVAVVHLPGDVGGGDSDPLRVVLMLAVAAFAGPLGGWIAGAPALGITAGTFAGDLAIMGIKAAVGLAGAALVSALLPPPKLPTPRAYQSLAEPSPTYSINAQGNLAKLDSAIPCHFGRMLAFPDFAALPYTEYSGDEQYLYQLFCIGVGSYWVEQVRIQDTDVAAFDEIEYEVVEPGESVTMFPTNVATAVEVAGQELIKDEYIGPFVVNAAGTEVTAVAFDMVMPRGLYEVNETTGDLQDVSLTFRMETRQVDDDGTPLTAWTTQATQTESGKSTTPLRRSYRYVVPLGRYELRATRTDVKQTDSRFGHEVLWAGARGYMPETRDFGDVTLLAMRMRASNNISQQASRKVNVIATRKLPQYNDGEWTDRTATWSPAWAIADMLRNPDYGAGLDDSRIDLDALSVLAVTWFNRHDFFNGRFDSRMTLWEALEKVCQVGRVKPYMQAGIVRFVRDEQIDTPVALFSMRNIVRNSFNIEYILPTEDNSDAVEISYFDEDVWAPRKVMCALAGQSTANPAKLELFGVTNRDQAHREGVYYAATNKYRRRVIRFQTEMEGFIPAVGDLIAVQHDMPAWGQSSETTGYDETTQTLTVSETFDWRDGVTNYIGLRNRDGSVDGPIEVTPGLTEYDLVLASAPLETPNGGGDFERTHVVFGWSETWRQPAKVVSVKPLGLHTVEIEAINEDGSVHTAEDGVTSPPIVTSQLPNQWTRPVIKNLIIRAASNDITRMLLTWTPAPGAETYQIEVASGNSIDDANLVWTRVGETSASSFALFALYGYATVVRVRGVRVAVGPWVYGYFGDAGDFMWSADSSTLMWDANDSTLMWG